MTYKEIKDRLTKCEKSLLKIKASSSTAPLSKKAEEQVVKLELLKESLTKQLAEAQSKTYLVTPKSGQTTAVSMSDDETDALKDADDVKAIKGIDGEEIKEDQGTIYSVDDTKGIAKKVGLAVAKALKSLGDEIAHMKAKNIEENSFEIHVEYKKDGKDDTFAFHIQDDNLHLADFSFNKVMGQVGTKPSGEAIVQVDVIANELQKHWKSMQEGMSDEEWADAKEKERLDKHPEKDIIRKIQSLVANEKAKKLKEITKEGEGDDHHYIKVSRRDYKKVMSILDNNVDPTYVKTEVVDDDGAGNVIIYFVFRHEYGFDSMYDDPEGKENPELYQEPDEDPSGFMYDVVMDLQAQDIEVVDHSADMDEALDHNDPVLMRARVAKMRANDMKKLDALKKSDKRNAPVKAIIAKLKAKRAQVEREMENDPGIEPEGGPVADKYGDMLNKIDNAIEKAATKLVKENQPTVFDDESFDALRDIILKYVEDPDDAEKLVQQVDDHGLDSLPSDIEAQLERDPEFEAWYHKLHYGSDADTDYMQRRRAEKDYQNEEEEDEFAGSDPKAGSTIQGTGFDWKKKDEDVDVGHQDDEPHMLKKDLYDVITYASKLYKALDKYDNANGEVDFPHWWQKKVTLAREYMSSAQHYLEGEEKQPAIDQLALEHVIKSRGLVKEGTDLYDRNGIQITRFSGGKRGLMVQINYGGKYIHVPADEFPILARAMQSVIGDIRDMTLQMPRKNYPKSVREGRKDNDALFPDNPRLPEIKELADKIVSMVKAEAAKGELGYINTMEEIRYQQEDDFERTPEWNKAKGIRADFNEGVAKIQKAHGLVVAKMKELAKQYKGGDKSVVGQLKDLTAKKKALEAQLDKAVSDKGRGQELDTNINEVTEDQVQDAIQELRDLIDEIESKGEEAREVVRQVFPNELSRLDAYGAFSNMYSANRYDVTLGGFVDRLEEEGFEIEDGEVFTNEGDYKSDAQRKAVHASKAEKEKLNEYTDDTFGGAELIKDVSKDSPDMFGKQLFADLMPKGVASEDEAVKALHAHDKSRIKQRMGGRLAPMFVHVQYHDLEHDGEKYRLHNRQYYNSNFKDKDPDFNPAVSKITLIKVIKSVDAKRGHDKTENLGSILVKTDAYVQDVRDLESQGKLGDRHMEEIIKEEATCCGRCGRVHVKGSGCKRPYLKGNKHCRTK